jgi:hypothetical protein
MTIENVLSALGLLGIGGVLGTYLRILWERRNTALLHKQEFKETRFKCIILLMYAALNFEDRDSGLKEHARNFSSREDVIDELKAEWHNAILFASDEVLKTIFEFLKEPSVRLFKQAALAMRKDLWGGKAGGTLEGLEF